MNLTKTIRKTPVDLALERQGETYVDTPKQQPKYDEEGKWVRVAACWAPVTETFVVLLTAAVAVGQPCATTQS